MDVQLDTNDLATMLGELHIQIRLRDKQIAALQKGLLLAREGPPADPAPLNGKAVAADELVTHHGGS